MRLSIVTTMYHSAPYLREFYARVCAEAEKLTDEYEIVFVNDGSPDNSLEVAVSLYEADDRVKVLDLSRNFGHHKAVMTGLAHARGELVFLLDSDLEEKPEWLGQFHMLLMETGADVVYGVQRARKGDWIEQFTGAIFYHLFNLLSSYPVPINPVAARLMRQGYVASLLEHKDREIFLAGLWAITGFKQEPAIVTKECKGSSTYNLRRRFSLFINAITSFSNKPLVFIFYLGCGIVFCSSLAALYLIIRRIFFGALLAGWPSLIVSVWLLGGLTIFCLGVIGIYLAKVFMETKQRPYTIIKQIYEQKEEDGAKLPRHSDGSRALLYREDRAAWSHSERR